MAGIPGTVTKSLFQIAKPSASKTVGETGGFFNKSVVKNINVMPKKQKSYYQNVGAIGQKLSSFEDTLQRIGDVLVSPQLVHDLSKVGMSKVALELLKNDGKDYGRMEDLNFVKAACVLGSRLAMINRDYGQIISGLSHLKDLA